MSIQKETIRTDYEGRVFGTNSDDGLEYQSTGLSAKDIASVGHNVEKFCGLICSTGAKVILDEDYDDRFVAEGEHVLWIHETEESRIEMKKKS